MEFREGTYGEDPLEGNGDAPCPLVVSLVVSVGGSGDDDTANGPGHLEGGCAGTSEGNGDNLGCVGGGVGDEEAPWNTLEGLTDGENGKRVGLHSELVSSYVAESSIQNYWEL